jgi:cytochrome c oxidase assembly factor CtaG
MLTEIGQLLEQSLTTHMIVHDFLFLVSGFLLAYGTNSSIEIASHLSNRLRRGRNILSRARLGAKALNILAFGSAALLIAYWYLPVHFNAAAANVSSNAEMHVALLLAGSLIFVGACFLSKRLKLIALVIVGKALGLYGMFLILTPRGVYSIYPGYEQVYAGAALLFLMLVLDFTVMPLWLYNYFGKASGSSRVGNTIAVAKD